MKNKTTVTSKGDGQEEPRKARGPVAEPGNVKHSAQEQILYKRVYGYDHKRNIEGDCWASTMLIWLNKNVAVSSLKEFKLPQFSSRIC